MFERQKPFVYVRYSSPSAMVLHDLASVLQIQNHWRPVIFKMVSCLKYDKDDIKVMLNNYNG